VSSVHGHRSEAKAPVRVAVITVSTSRSRAAASGSPVEDESGDLACSMVRKAGFRVVSRRLVGDDVNEIRGAVLECLRPRLANVLLLLGGTGLSSADVTPEAVEPLLQKRLPGFGELFRYRSSLRIGPAAMMSRALAGSVDGTVIFALPGSPDGVRLALTILLPELPHMVSICRT